MARATFVKAARKDNPVVKKGESYWWWQFRYGPKQYSKEMPSRSQLTQSDFLSQLYSVVDALPDEMTEADVNDFRAELQTLTEQLEENLSNMPEQLQDGSIVKERIDMLEDWASTLESIETEDPERMEEESDDDYEDRLMDFHEQIANEVKDADPGF